MAYGRGCGEAAGRLCGVWKAEKPSLDWAEFGRDWAVLVVLVELGGVAQGVGHLVAEAGWGDDFDVFAP